MRSTVKIKFDVNSHSSWILGLLDNKNLLEDLSERAIREFARDLAKMNSLSIDAVDVELKDFEARRDFSHRRDSVFI